LPGIGKRRPAMHEVDPPLACQQLQIAAYGLARDAELPGEIRDADRARDIEELRDLLLAADGDGAVHAGALSRNRHLVAFCGVIRKICGVLPRGGFSRLVARAGPDRARPSPASDTFGEILPPINLVIRFPLIPAKAGTQTHRGPAYVSLGPRFRGD